MQMKKKQQQQVNKHKSLPTNAQNREGLIKRKSVIWNKLHKFTNISRNEKKRITRDYYKKICIFDNEGSILARFSRAFVTFAHFTGIPVLPLSTT